MNTPIIQGNCLTVYPLAVWSSSSSRKGVSMKFQRIYNNGSLGPKRTIETEQIVFLQAGDKVPGEFIDFHLHSEELKGRLFEVGSPSGQPGFIYKIVAIPQGSYINEKMVVERY